MSKALVVPFGLAAKDAAAREKTAARRKQFGIEA